MNLDEIPRCAWCDERSAGWAKVEPGYGPPHPSCGEHGAEFAANHTVTELIAEVVRLRGVAGERRDRVALSLSPWMGQNGIVTIRLTDLLDIVAPESSRKSQDASTEAG